MGKNKISVIIAREYAIRVKKKSFILTTIFAPILMAAIFVVPMLIAAYSEDGNRLDIKVSDNSGIVMPYLENGETLLFEDASGISLDTLKAMARRDESLAVLSISPLDSNRNVTLSLYSEKQINADNQSHIRRMAEEAVEANKLAGYNIPGLEKIVEDIKPEVKVNTFLVDDSPEGEKASKVEIYMVIGYVASFLIYMFIFMFGGMVMRSVIDEKSNRIVEVIVSSVKPFQLMMGKIIGVAAVGLTQFLIWIVLTLALVSVAIPLFGPEEIIQGATAQTDQVSAIMESSGVEADAVSAAVPAAEFESGAESFINALSSINFTQIIICFLVYFLLGYLLYSGMFAAVGSAVDNEADTQQLSLPITVPLIVGLFIMLHTFQYPDSSLSFWASIIPFTSPMVMMARIAYGVPFWELLLSISLLIVTFLLLTYISGRIYRIGILMYGKKASWKDLSKWIRYKD